MEIKMKGGPCKHEIDPSTIKYKGGFSKGECTKCGAALTRIYPLNQNPVRTKPKLNKKERKKLRDSLREKHAKGPGGELRNE